MINPVSGNPEFLCESTARQEVLNHLKHYFESSDLAPVLQFETLIGMISTSLNCHLITCNLTPICVTLK